MKRTRAALHGVAVLAVLVLVGCAAAPTQHATTEHSVAEMFAELTAVENDRSLIGAKRTHQLAEVYARTIAPLHETRSLAVLDSDELRLVFRAARKLVFYSSELAYLGAMRSALREMERRGIATQQDHAKLFRALVKLRYFDQAHSLLAAHPAIDVEPLPTIIEQLGVGVAVPTVLAVGPIEKSLVHRAAGLAQGAHIVVVGHPMCHFSENAVMAIEADPMMQSVFQRRALWITPQDGRLYMGVMQTWNEEHPDTPMAITYKSSEWPLLDDWETPTFYFIKDGVVAAKVNGWPKEGRRAALLDGMKKIGLRPAL